MKLKSSPKIFNKYKCDFPESTTKRIKDGLRKIGFEPVYTQQKIISNDFPSYYGELLIEELGFLTCGKGVTANLAKASAYAEMAERISSCFFVFHTVTNDIERRTKLLKDIIDRKFLRGYTKINKNIKMKNINKYVEKKLTNEEVEILKDQGLFDIYVNAYSFIKDKNMEIPVNFIEVLSGSTGLASGNTMEEAFVQGTCEILERYSTYKVLSEKIECPTISKNSIEDATVKKFIEMFESMNIDIQIKDFSLGRGLPVICIIFTNNNIKNDQNKLKKNLYYKMIDVGSHPDLNQAIIRCFTERLQGVTKEEFMYRNKCDFLYNYWTKDLGKRYVETKEISKDLFIDYEACGDISFLEKGKEISFANLTSKSNYDCLDDCNYLIDICKKNNWDIQAIDYTHKTLEIPSLRIIIPPISTSHDPYMLQSLKIEDVKERLDSLYEFTDFYKFVVEDDWINNDTDIEKLVHNIEEFLSKNPLNYRFFIRQGHFLYFINLFHLLAISNFSINNYAETLKYLDVLINLNDRPSFLSPYFNNLLNPSSNKSLFLKYKESIVKGMENNDLPTFHFKSNPFKITIVADDFEKTFDSLLKNLNKSYFVKLQNH